MYIRRSLLSFLVGAVIFFSLSLILLLTRSSYAPAFAWRPGSAGTGQEQDVGNVDQPMRLGHSWLDPKPGDDTLRKNPSQDVDDFELNDTLDPRPVAVSSPLLRSRLQMLLDTPVLSHEAAAIQNEKTCPRVFSDKQVNQDQFKGNREKWIAVSEADIRTRRSAIARHLGGLEKEGIVIMGNDLEATDERRGVVMTAGNKDTAQTALVTIRMLRQEYKSALPVEVFSFPGELRDQNIIQEMKQLDATHHELQGFQKAAGSWKNFHLKAASILASRFTEVLYLDSDNVPLRDPAYLFDEEAYKSGGGAVFWPDFNKDHTDNAIWRVLGKTCNYTEWEVESGQILIDKRGNNGLNLAALHVAAHMQANHDFWFTLSGGDKDTFRYAFWALGATYLAAPRWLSSLGSSSDAVLQQGKFCGYVMLQYDIAKNERGQRLPLFLHANLLKHRYGSDPAQRVFQTIKRASQDDANDRSLDRARMWVYDEGGMCVDLEVDATTTGGAGALQEQKAVTESFTELYEGVFKDFEVQFFRQKGKVGGW